MVIRINGANPTFDLQTDPIEHQLLVPANELLLDLLDVAASVFAADSSVPRGGATRPEFGAGWRRRMTFSIPVRSPDIWNRPEVTAALVDAVEFLTDDEVAFEFHKGRQSIGPQQYFDFAGDSAHSGQIEDVLLFSGGLDSLSGAVERLTQGPGRIALVTHLSANKIIKHQKLLIEALKKRFPGRILHIPIRATRKGSEAAETTQRSRSFLFASLAYVVARMLGAKRIAFYENGIVSHNLPISTQVIGTMATRTTHPLSLVKLGAFLDTLGGSPIPIENRFAWLTKAEVITRLTENGGADLIKTSISCTQVRDQSVLHTHCGACSQCLDRRFAMLATGLHVHEPDDMYLTDVISGARDAGRSRTIALDWIAHACRLADLSQRDWMDRFGSELLRIVEGLPNLSGTDALQRIIALHQRHSNTVKKALEDAVAKYAPDLVSRSLPVTSLLRLYLNDPPGTPSLPRLARGRYVSAEPSVAAPTLDAGTRDTGIFPLQVAFHNDGKDDLITVRGLGEVRGRSASAAHLLRPAYEEDQKKGLNSDNHTFVPAMSLFLPVHVSKAAVRKCVQRCRDALAEFYRAIEGHDPPRDLLIENKPQRGYRLDPTCKIVDRDQSK